MALIDPPAFLGLSGNEYPAARFRRLAHVHIAGREGVTNAASFIVSPTGTPGLSVQVSQGVAFVAGDDSSRQGVYLAESTATVTVGPIATPHASLPRFDLVILEVLDQEGTGTGGGGRGSDLARFRIVAGTPSSAPVLPALPPTAIPLAQIAVSAGMGAITAPALVDRRPQCNLRAGDVGEVGWSAAGVPWGAVAANGVALPAVGDGGWWDTLRAHLLAAGSPHGTDGSGNPRVPDLMGRVAMGAGSGPGLTARALGQQVGAEPMAAHVHDPGTLATSAEQVSLGLWVPGSASTWVTVADPDATLGPRKVPSLASMETMTPVNATQPHGHTITGTTGSAGAGNHGVVQPSTVLTPFVWC